MEGSLISKPYVRTSLYLPEHRSSLMILRRLNAIYDRLPDYILRGVDECRRR